MDAQTPPPHLTTPFTAEPIQSRERIEVLDVIRGFALLGILIANMSMFSSPAMFLDIVGENPWTGFWNKLTTSFINLFVQGKFYSMFSFLFGLGFSIFLERAKTRTAKPVKLFHRRLFVLLIIGLIHAFFIWSGDILVSYALLGFLLPLFFNVKPKTLLLWALALFLVFIMFMSLSMGMVDLLKSAQEDIFNQALGPFIAETEKTIANSYHAYGNGTFAEIMSQRAVDSLSALSQVFMNVFIIFPLFLIGLYAGKKEIFQNIEANLPFIKRVWTWSFVIGFIMSLVKFAAKTRMAEDFFSFNTAIHFGAGVFADTGLCLFYITTLVLLCRNTKWMVRLRPLAYMGRMALSNYLLQSIICTTIFYNYGLGLYGKVGPAWGLVLTLVIYIIQIFISKYWFKYFRFGPMEWVWRSLTYGRRFKMRL